MIGNPEYDLDDYPEAPAPRPVESLGRESVYHGSCLRCGDARTWGSGVVINHEGICSECVADLTEKAESYGGSNQSIADRLSGYLAIFKSAIGRYQRAP